MKAKCRNRILNGLMGLATLLTGACAGLQEPVDVGAAGEKTVAVEASNFEFTPNHLLARQGQALVLEVENVSGNGHNITILDPQGAVVADVDLAAGVSERVQVTLGAVGTYQFHCGRPFHPTMGMKGVIEVR